MKELAQKIINSTQEQRLELIKGIPSLQDFKKLSEKLSAAEEELVEKEDENQKDLQALKDKIAALKKDMAEFTKNLKELLIELVEHAKSVEGYKPAPQLTMMLKIARPPYATIYPQLGALCKQFPEPGESLKLVQQEELSDKDKMDRIIKDINDGNMPIYKYPELLYKNHFYKNVGNDQESDTFLTYALPKLKNPDKFLQDLEAVIGAKNLKNYAQMVRIRPKGATIEKLDVFAIYLDSFNNTVSPKITKALKELRTKLFFVQQAKAIQINNVNTHITSANKSSNKWHIATFKEMIQKNNLTVECEFPFEEKVNIIPGMNAELNKFVEDKNNELMNEITHILSLSDAEIFKRYLRLTGTKHYETKSYQLTPDEEKSLTFEEQQSKLLTAQEKKYWDPKIATFRFQLAAAKRYMEEMITIHWCGKKTNRHYPYATNIATSCGLTIEQMIAAAYSKVIEESKDEKSLSFVWFINRMYDIRRGYNFDAGELDKDIYIVAMNPGDDENRCTGGAINGLSGGEHLLINKETVANELRKIYLDIIQTHKTTIENMTFTYLEMQSWKENDQLPEKLKEFLQKEFDSKHSVEFISEYDGYGIKVNEIIGSGLNSLTMPKDLNIPAPKIEKMDNHEIYKILQQNLVPLLYLHAQEGYISTLNYLTKYHDREDIIPYLFEQACLNLDLKLLTFLAYSDLKQNFKITVNEEIFEFQNEILFIKNILNVLLSTKSIQEVISILKNIPLPTPSSLQLNCFKNEHFKLNLQLEKNDIIELKNSNVISYSPLFAIIFNSLKDILSKDQLLDLLHDDSILNNIPLFLTILEVVKSKTLGHQDPISQAYYKCLMANMLLNSQKLQSKPEIFVHVIEAMKEKESFEEWLNYLQNSQIKNNPLLVAKILDILKDNLKAEHLIEILSNAIREDNQIINTSQLFEKIANQILEFKTINKNDRVSIYQIITSKQIKNFPEIYAKFIMLVLELSSDSVSIRTQIAAKFVNSNIHKDSPIQFIKGLYTAKRTANLPVKIAEKCFIGLLQSTNVYDPSEVEPQVTHMLKIAEDVDPLILMDLVVKHKDKPNAKLFATIVLDFSRYKLVKARSYTDILLELLATGIYNNDLPLFIEEVKLGGEKFPTSNYYFLLLLDDLLQNNLQLFTTVLNESKAISSISELEKILKWVVKHNGNSEVALLIKEAITQKQVLSTPSDESKEQNNITYSDGVLNSINIASQRSKEERTRSK